MSKIQTAYICNSCNNEFKKWSGKCLNCGTWDSIELKTKNLHKSIKTISSTSHQEIKIHDLSEVTDHYEREETSYKEFNKLLGEGIVPGSVLLFSGEPGIGKSTFLMQLAYDLANDDENCYYFTGEESVRQVQLRAKRLNTLSANIKLANLSSIDKIINILESDASAKYVVIDSIQTMFLESHDATPGSLTQIRNVTFALSELAKRKNITLFLIAHVTKDGQIAGPKIVEHMVDVVLYFEGDKHNNFRILRSIKNRYGSTDEILVLAMQKEGLKEINNPSQIFLSKQTESLPGNCLFPYADGNKIFILETQGLLISTHLATPRRAADGFDQNRLAIIIAILFNRAKINLTNLEVYCNVTAGTKVVEPAIDLSICASLISAFLNIPIPSKTIAFGEVGLAGEVRPVNKAELRIKEAIRLGYENIILPEANLPDKKEANINFISVNHVSQLARFIKS